MAAGVCRSQLRVRERSREPLVILGHGSNSVPIPALARRSVVRVGSVLHRVGVKSSVYPGPRVFRAEGRAVIRQTLVPPVRIEQPGGSLRGERAKFTRLVLGCIEAKFCK